MGDWEERAIENHKVHMISLRDKKDVSSCSVAFDHNIRDWQLRVVEDWVKRKREEIDAKAMDDLLF